MRVCMTTGEPVKGDEIARDDDVIVIVRKGKIIGVLSELAQRDVRTLRFTLTRISPESEFQPLVAVALDTFKPLHGD